MIVKSKNGKMNKKNAAYKKNGTTVGNLMAIIAYFFAENTAKYIRKIIMQKFGSSV